MTQLMPKAKTRRFSLLKSFASNKVDGESTHLPSKLNKAKTIVESKEQSVASGAIDRESESMMKKGPFLAVNARHHHNISLYSNSNMPSSDDEQ